MPIIDPREMSVAQQIVTAIDVECTAHRAAQVTKLMLATDQSTNAGWQFAINGNKLLVDLGTRVHNNACSPIFVRWALGDSFLKQVREWAMTDVMQKRGGETFLCPLGVQLLVLGEIG